MSEETVNVGEINKEYVPRTKSHTNYFKFILYQGNEKIVTRIFDADKYNPLTRYSVDIRKIIPWINQQLQKTLCSRNLLYGDDNYDYIKIYKDTRDAVKRPSENKLEKPEYKVHVINEKQIRGVECRFGLYINDNPIVERDFYVDGYNPAVRFSTELTDVVKGICDEIKKNIFNNDKKNMWDDYYLIKNYRIQPQRLREISLTKRREMVANLDNPNYIKMAKSNHNNNR
jgi:hypothetical protein